MNYLDKNGLSRLWSKIKTLVNNSISDIYPIGGGLDYYGLNLPSNKWMWANGQAISRTEYSELFNIIGTIYGEGDGLTTFNLPDKRKRVSVMAGASGTLSQLGAIGGEESHTLTVDETPSHTHTFTGSSTKTSKDGSHYHDGLTIDGAFIGVNNGDSTKGYGQGMTYSSSLYATKIRAETKNSTHQHSFTASGSNSSTGGGLSHNNLQPYLICNYMIKVK